jgi:DNA-binding ferritin-like protein
MENANNHLKETLDQWAERIEKWAGRDLYSCILILEYSSFKR